MTKQIAATILFAIFFSCDALALLNAEQQLAREKGIVLYGQSAWDSAQPFLRTAAEAGDSSAQYYLGEALRLNSMYTTAEARKWYEAAAAQNHLYAMLRLSGTGDLCSIVEKCEEKSGEKWLIRAVNIAHQRAEQGDTAAMTVLFAAREGLQWLERAAEGGDAYSQNILARVYKEGGGWFLIPGNRERAVKKWYRASAEGGYAKGMFHYANYLYDHNDNNDSKEEIIYWVMKGAEAGHIDSLATVAGKIAIYPNDIGLPLNLVKAYGFRYLLANLVGGGAAPTTSRRKLIELREKMTPEQVQQGIAFAEEWARTHPPLSYFPSIYGY